MQSLSFRALPGEILVDKICTNHLKNKLKPQMNPFNSSNVLAMQKNKQTRKEIHRKMTQSS